MRTARAGAELPEQRSRGERRRSRRRRRRKR